MVRDAVVGQRHDGGRIAVGVRMDQQRHGVTLPARQLTSFRRRDEADDRDHAVRLMMDFEVSVLARGKERRGQRRRAGEAVHAARQVGRRKSFFARCDEAHGVLTPEGFAGLFGGGGRSHRKVTIICSSAAIAVASTGRTAPGVIWSPPLWPSGDAAAKGGPRVVMADFAYPGVAGTQNRRLDPAPLWKSRSSFPFFVLRSYSLP